MMWVHLRSGGGRGIGKGMGCKLARSQNKPFYILRCLVPKSIRGDLPVRLGISVQD